MHTNCSPENLQKLLKMVSNAEGFPETLARALVTNSPENWLTAITDLGILSSQESVEVEGSDGLCPQTQGQYEPLLEEQAVTVNYTQEHQLTSSNIPHLQELRSWPCTVTPEPSPTPSYSTESAFDFNSIVSPLSPASTDVAASPSPSLGSESASDIHFIKEGLRKKIQTKRRRSGLGELAVEIKEELHDVLTPADENRRERRRASNRRAALKCRQKKKEAQDQFMEEYRKTQERYKKLERDYNELKERFDEHMSHCTR